MSPAALEFNVGPLCFVLEGEPPPAARDLLIGYQSAAPPLNRLRLHFRRETGPPFMPLPPPFSGTRYEMEITDTAAGMNCVSYFFTARLPLPSAPGDVLPPGEVVWRDCPPAHEPLIVHNVLRQWAACLLPAYRLLLLHAGGCLIDGRAVLFTGTSGAGKSTATAFCAARFPSLGDDIIALDFRGAAPAALPIPCFNPKAPPSAALKPHPLGMINRIIQAPRHALRPLPPEVALTVLIGQAPFVNIRPALIETALDLLAEKLGDLPLYELELMKNDGFIARLEQELMKNPRLLSSP